MRSDDIKHCLDILDSVIGEYDDGLASSAESDVPLHRPLSYVQYGLRRSTGYLSQDFTIEPDVRKKAPPKMVPATSRQSLNEKIDDIFSELNEEIYYDSKARSTQNLPRTVDAAKTKATRQWVAQHRQKSPVRRMDDPLPSPPAQPSHSKPSPAADMDEVMVYSERERQQQQEMFALKKSVKAQVHSLEAKSRLQNEAKAKKTKPFQPRSRSENPPQLRNSLNANAAAPPPPMPEKVKIHLKNASLDRKAEDDVADRQGVEKMKKSPYGRNSSHSNSRYDKYKASAIGKNLSEDASNEARGRQMSKRTSRPVGPVVEAAQKHIAHIDFSKQPQEAKERRSRSRGRSGASAQPKNSNLLAPSGKSKKAAVTHGTSSSDGSKGKTSVTSDKRRLASPFEAIDRLLPKGNLSKMPSRQKSMIDLREPAIHWDFPRPHAGHQRNLLAASSSGLQPAASAVSQRPKMVRSATEHDIKHRPRRVMPPVGPGGSYLDLPPHIKQHMIRQHGYQFGDQHEDLMGHLGSRASSKEDPFMMRKLTIEAQREFMLRKGFSPSHPFISGEVPIHPELQGQLPFNAPSRTIPLRPDDYRRFKPELWLGDPNPNPVAFNDMAMLQNELELRRRREIHRHNSQRRGAANGGSPADTSDNFSSLPWNELIPRRQMEQFHHQLQQYMEQQQHQHQHRSRSQDSRRKGRPFSLLGGSGWFNPSQVWQEAEPDLSVRMGGGPIKKQGQWLLKERVISPLEQNQLQSMPSISLSAEEEASHSQNFLRTSNKRSSFGMALKDKFQKNPNMYFPGAEAKSASSNSSSQKRSSLASKSATTLDDDISDTDTLIHNMSEGSYEKDGSSSLGSTHGGKGSRSSGNSSLSPHNSMEGSPRMISRREAQFETPSSTNSQVSMNKKTIRNYTPKESSNMLREFEDRRNNSSDWRKQRGRSSGRCQTVIEESDGSKSAMEKMIEDFHRNLPPPPRVDPRQMSQDDATITTLDSKHLNTTNTSLSLKNGTVSSQMSNWSAVSSVASFDYQPANDKDSSGLGSTDQKVVERRVSSPREERTPPEGASTESVPFVQRIEVKAEDFVKSVPQSAPKAPPAKGKRTAPNAEDGRETKEVVGEVPAVPAGDIEDEFSNLRKLISEGRISGLSEKPPSFVPPTPPTAKRPSATRKKAGQPESSKNDRSRKSRDAPKPPADIKRHVDVNSEAKAMQSEVIAEVKLLNSRLRESLEDLTKLESRRQSGGGGSPIKRSSSNHGTRPTGYGDVSTAKLIADSTEKKFNFNPFKGMWKKKHYSFDFSS